MNTKPIDQILECFRSGELIHPFRSGKVNFIDVLNAIQHELEVEGTPPLRSESAQVLESIKGAEHLVFILVDALGMHLIDRLPESHLLRKHLNQPITSVFPSTTAAAIT